MTCVVFAVVEDGLVLAGHMREHAAFEAVREVTEQASEPSQQAPIVRAHHVLDQVRERVLTVPDAHLTQLALDHILNFYRILKPVWGHTFF